MCNDCIYCRKDGSCKHPDFSALWYHNDCQHKETIDKEAFMQIVKVQYKNQGSSGTEYSSREYSYLSEENLKVNDIVTVPVRDTVGQARVTAIDIPESEIAAFRDKIKIIPSGSIVAVTIQSGLPLFDIPKPPETILDMAEKMIETSQLGNNGNFTETLPVAPASSEAFISLAKEVTSLSNYAANRVIASNDDVKIATDDLGLIAKLAKAVDELRTSYVKPLNDQVKQINDTFKTLSNPLDTANQSTRAKILAYRAEVERIRLEAEAINRQKDELARREAAINDGAYTVDTTPVAVPVSAPAKVYSDTATLGTRKIRKARVVNFALLPDAYKLPNQKLLDSAASTGAADIPGVEYYIEESLRVNTR